MPSPILVTKLFIPTTRPELVSRPRLISQLDRGLNQKLTLISAPAGFGKTTLVTDWLQSKGGDESSPFAITWLSLDEGDNDLTRFLTYFIAALNQIEDSGITIGEGVMNMLQSPQPPEIEYLLTPLINEIAIISKKIILVLDDYHLIAESAIHDALNFLLDNLPPQIHLVITTREDPFLNLSRLRARNQLTELRAADLRFMTDEAAEFLNQVMGLTLSGEDVTALAARTEGWITGLQMAAISMQGRTDTTNFIHAFTGSHRFVLDYLIEEVLLRQPEQVRSFLLQTSILERLTGPLCEAVRLDETQSPDSSVGTTTTEEDGKKMLANLERENLFIIPLDDNREWYRYHHIFADVLRDRLAEFYPDQIPLLHQRASDWYVQNDLPSDGIYHAIAAEDNERIATIAELTWQHMDNSFQLAIWLDWVKELPDEVLQNRPILCTQYGWALADRGQLEHAETHLQNAEKWLETFDETAAEGWNYATAEEASVQSLPALIALARANKAQYEGDNTSIIKYAAQALERIPAEDHLKRAQATAILGMTNWESGNLDAAHSALSDWADSMYEVGNLYFAIASSFALADIQVEQGLLQEAIRTYQESLAQASDTDEIIQRIVAHHHLGLAMLYHEIGDQEASAQHLQKCERLGEKSNLIDWPYRWHVAQAQLKESMGDLDAALGLLDEAKRVYIQNPVPDIRPAEALKARIFLKQGRLEKAQDWVRIRGLLVDDELSYLNEFEHIMLARVLIAQYQKNQIEQDIRQAISLLDRLLLAAKDNGWSSFLLEILIVQALASEAQGDTEAARKALDKALTLAEPEGYLRTFVDEGTAMAHLLYEAMAGGIKPTYVQRLLGTFPMDEPSFDKAENKEFLASEGIEPLSEREIEVLQLISEGLMNQEIADKLYLSLHTVKGHARNIYGKLGVKNRTQAIAKGKSLGILAPN